MLIVGNKVKLRSLEFTDLEKLNEWSNDPSLWKLLGGWHTLEEVQKYGFEILMITI